MKSITGWACALVLVAAGVTFAVLGRQPTVLAIEPPPAPAATVAPAPDLVSSVNVRLSIAQDAIREAIDTFVPRSFDGRENDPIGAVSDDVLSWSLAIGAAELGSRDGALSFRIPITRGTVRLVGRIGARRRNTGALGWLERIAGVDLDQTVTFDGAVSGTLRPRLNADWTLDPDLRAEVSLSTAQAELFGGLLKISLRDVIRDRIDDEVRRQGQRLRQRLAEDGRIVSAVQQVWDAMHAVVPLSQEPPVWLSWQPLSLAASVPVAGEGRVTMTLGTRVSVAVEVAPDRPEIARNALPAPDTPAEDGAIALRIPVTLRLDAFAGVVPQRLGLPERIEHEGVTIVLDAVSILGVSDELTVAAEVTVVHDWLPDMKATLYVTGTPVLERETNRLRLSGARYEVSTRNALLGVADALLEPVILEQIERRSVFEILESEAELLARADREFDLISASLPDWVEADLSIDSGRLRSVRARDGWLVAVLEATGRASVRVDGLAELLGDTP